MSTEASIVLVVIGMIAAWWLGRRSVRKVSSTDLGVLPAHYFQGLNYLLNEQPDKAIEVFIKLIEVDSETIETHFALGNLFRRRGEVDRAIRIHQSLIVRPALSKEQRTQALYELGLDYMRSGILSRAEAVFQQLIDDESRGAASLKQIIEIYQQEREWRKAIDAAEKLERASGERKSATIAQYHCEIAEQYREAGDFTHALQSVRAALQQDPQCVRASLLAAAFSLHEGDAAGAIELLKRVETQDADFLPEIFPLLIAAYQQMGHANGALDDVRLLFQKHGGVSSLLALAELIRQRDGDAQSAAFIAEQLRKKPSVRGLDRLIALSVERSSGQARDNLLVLKELTTTLLQNKPAYKCRHCGFNAKALHWHCPGCQTWNSLKPVEGVEGE